MGNGHPDDLHSLDKENSPLNDAIGGNFVSKTHVTGKFIPKVVMETNCTRQNDDVIFSDADTTEDEANVTMYERNYIFKEDRVETKRAKPKKVNTKEEDNQQQQQPQ